MKIEHILDENGNHAIVIDGKVGPWTEYTSIAENECYRALTDFFLFDQPDTLTRSGVYMVMPIPEDIEVTACQVADPNHAEKYRESVTDLDDHIANFNRLGLKMTAHTSNHYAPKIHYEPKLPVSEEPDPADDANYTLKP